MSDPKDLEHYLEERIDEKNKAAQQARLSPEREEAEIRKSQNRRRAAITLLTDTIIPFLEESKKALTKARLVVNPKATYHEVVGVTFQIRDLEEKVIHSSVYEIDIGTEIPLVRSRKEADEQSAGVDLADEVGVRKFEDLDTKAVRQLLKIAIDEYVSVRARFRLREFRLREEAAGRDLRAHSLPARIKAQRGPACRLPFLFDWPPLWLDCYSDFLSPFPNGRAVRKRILRVYD